MCLSCTQICNNLWEEFPSLSLPPSLLCFSSFPPPPSPSSLAPSLSLSLSFELSRQLILSSPSQWQWLYLSNSPAPDQRSLPPTPSWAPGRLALTEQCFGRTGELLLHLTEASDHCSQGFPGHSGAKESALQCRRSGFDPWVGKIPWRRAWQPTCILAWRIPWMEEPGGLRSMGSQRAGHDWVSNTHEGASAHCCQERMWTRFCPTFQFFKGRIQWNLPILKLWTWARFLQRPSQTQQ